MELHLVMGISDALMQTVTRNDQLFMSNPSLLQRFPPISRVFTGNAMPPISVYDYCMRIVRNTKCAMHIPILALIYIDRAMATRRIMVYSQNIHRILLASMVMGLKFYDDEYYVNGIYATIGGVSLEELNALEWALFRIVDFRLHVLPPLFQHYVNRIHQHAVQLQAARGGSPGMQQMPPSGGRSLQVNPPEGGGANAISHPTTSGSIPVMRNMGMQGMRDSQDLRPRVGYNREGRGGAIEQGGSSPPSIREEAAEHEEEPLGGALQTPQDELGMEYLPENGGINEQENGGEQPMEEDPGGKENKKAEEFLGGGGSLKGDTDTSLQDIQEPLHTTKEELAVVIEEMGEIEMKMIQDEEVIKERKDTKGIEGKHSGNIE